MGASPVYFGNTIHQLCVMLTSINAWWIEKLPVLIYGYTDWCGFCKKLEKTYFNDYEINKTLAQFIKVRINPENSSKDKQLFKSLGGRGYSTLFIQHPNQPLQRIDDPFVLLKNGKRGEVAPQNYLQVFLQHLKPCEQVTDTAAKN